MSKKIHHQTQQRISREESQILTRERLISTATRLFAEKGYGGTSLRDIAEQAGYSQGAFYSNFDSKETLLLEMLRRHMAAEAEQLALLTTQQEQQTDEILNRLESWAATLDQDINWSMLSIELQLHAQRSDTFAIAYQAVWQQHRDALAQCLQGLFTDKQLRLPVTAEEIAASFMALAHGLSLQRAATGNTISGSILVVLLRGLVAIASPLSASQNNNQQP